MGLPNVQTGDKDFQLLQSLWSAQLNPVLSIPLTKGITLQNVSLVTGDNVVNHLLQRKLQGWFLVRQRGLASIYDTQDTNQKQSLTLTLVSSANVSVDIFVY